MFKIIFTKKISEKELLKFGFKKTLDCFRNGQGIYVKDRHLNDNGKFSDTFYYDPNDKKIIYTNVGTTGVPYGIHVDTMYELKKFYNTHKAKNPYPEEKPKSNNNEIFSILLPEEIEMLNNDFRMQAITSIKKRLNISIFDAKEIVTNYLNHLT